MKSNFFVIALLLLSACGKDYPSYTGGSYSSPTTPPPDETTTEEKTPEPITSSSVTTKEETDTPTVVYKEPEIYRHPLNQYEIAEGTDLKIWESKATAILYDFNLGGALLEGLTKIANAGNPFYRPAVAVKVDGVIETQIKEYEEVMDDQYYFARVRKYRAPETAADNDYYTFFLAAAPDYKGKSKKIPSAEAAKMASGRADFLVPGGVGTGTEWIFVIPSDKVSTLGGFWDENITMQMGILKIDKNVLAGKEFTNAEEVTESVLMFEDKIDFYHMTKNEIYKKRYQTLTATGKPDAILDVEFWKGDWRSNDH